MTTEAQQHILTTLEPEGAYLVLRESGSPGESVFCQRHAGIWRCFGGVDAVEAWALIEAGLLEVVPLTKKQNQGSKARAYVLAGRVAA